MADSKTADKAAQPKEGKSVAKAAAKPPKSLFKKAYKILSSHLGLVVVLIIYSFIGAAIFQALEGPHETSEKTDIVGIRERIISDLWISSQNSSWEKINWTQLVRDQLHGYEGHLHSSFLHGINTDSEEQVWDFWGSLFYAATIYSTIGYGHIAPATDGGRIATMIYATIGIPLCLIVMADLGKLLTRGIKFLWAFVRRFFKTGSCIKPNKTEPSEGEVKEGEKEVYYGYEIDDEFNLPVIVAIAISVAYIVLGAGMYMLWEDWTYLEAFYFIFISVSTIGFGDVLPEHPRYFMVTSFYVLLGLSLVAMVINVIMEAVSGTLDKAKEKAKEMGFEIFQDEEEDKKEEAKAE